MNNNTFVHKYIRPLIGKDDIVADMTAGNGSDTLFLARYAKTVYAFDISEEAIRRSREKTAEYGPLHLCAGDSNGTPCVVFVRIE